MLTMGPPIVLGVEPNTTDLKDHIVCTSGITQKRPYMITSKPAIQK